MAFPRQHNLGRWDNMSIGSFYLPTRFIMGAGSLSQLGKQAAKLGKNALLVTGSKSMRSTGALDRVIKDLEQNGIAATTFEKVEPNPRATTIDEGARLAREKGVQFVIGLGGGSTMDASKCIAVASGGTDSITALYRGKAAPGAKALPIIAVPTVAASGSEANNVAVFTDWETHEKVVFFHPQTYPTVSIVDPELTLTLPARTTAQGGVDIFCHLVEAYITAGESTSINDALREACMRIVVESLPEVLSRLDDIELRSGISRASTIACSQFATVGGGTGALTMHGIEHPFSGVYDIAHGDGLAALLVEWLRFNLPVREARVKQLGKNVFGETDGIAAVQKWLKKVGMDRRLSAIGVKEADIDMLADNALRTAGPLPKLNPRPLDKAAVADIYKKAY
jgi:alcohol dehydrogenase class IV